MKTKTFATATILAMIIITLSSFTSSFKKWEKLGERKVDFGLDRDEIQSGVRDGLFTAIKFRVKRNAVDFSKVTVVYQNGDRDDITMRETIRGGGESRVIDLKGGNRIIDKVIFWYDSKNRKNIKAEVELWARR